MNNTQLSLSIGIPTLTVLLAWLSNRSDISSLRSEIKKVERSLNVKLESKLETIRVEINGLRKEIYASMVPLHERVAVVEAKKSDK